jgi:hypothetical protein
MNAKARQSETRRLEEAAADVERQKRQLAATLGALQYRLKPANLVNQAWEGVRDKSGEVADQTLQAVKDRPAAVSGVLAGIVLFIAREPIWRAVSGFFSRDEEYPSDIIQAKLDHDEDYDLTAPTVTASRPEGVNA